VNDTSRHDKPALPADALDAAIEALSSRTLSAMSGNRLSQDAAKWAAVVALEAAAPAIRDQATRAEVRRHVAEQDAIHADLGELLVMLGLGDYARPQSPHEVFQMCLARLREEAHAAYRNPDGSYHSSPPSEREAIRDQATAAERERWSARFRDLAATYLPNIMTAEGAQALARTDPNSPSQVRGRLLLDLADVLDGGTQ
jgi:hypothetical protein